MLTIEKMMQMMMMMIRMKIEMIEMMVEMFEMMMKTMMINRDAEKVFKVCRHTLYSAVDILHISRHTQK